MISKFWNQLSFRMTSIKTFFFQNEKWISNVGNGVATIFNTFYTTRSPSGLDISTLVSLWLTTWKMYLSGHRHCKVTACFEKFKKKPTPYCSNYFAVYMQFFYVQITYLLLEGYRWGGIYTCNCDVLFKSSIPIGPKWKLKVRENKEKKYEI